MQLRTRLRRSPSKARAANSDRWVVVGLGNPAAEYGGTRHNVGADVVRRIAARLGVAFKPHKAHAQIADTTHMGRPLTLAIPFGYMNESGGPVQAVTAFYKVPPERLVVVHDELDLAPHVVRLKLGGGTAGHNGLKDVHRRLGTPEFHRVRIGIGRPPGRMDPADYVLKRWSAKEREEVEVDIERAADAVLALVATGLEAAQNAFHAVERPAKPLRSTER